MLSNECPPYPVKNSSVEAQSSGLDHDHNREDGVGPSHDSTMAFGGCYIWRGSLDGSVEKCLSSSYSLAATLTFRGPPGIWVRRWQ